MFLLLGPILLFPQVVPAQARTMVVVAATVASFAAALVLLRPSPAIAALAAVLSGALIVGWTRASSAPASLSHFSGTGCGLLAFALVPRWCDDARRLRQVLGLFLVISLCVLILGAIGAAPPYAKLLRPDDFVKLPQFRLGLAGLPKSGYVNDNALGGTAMLVVPLAGAGLFAGIRGGGGRAIAFLAGVTAALAVFVVYFTQSRSAWLAGWAVLAALALRFGHGGRNRAIAILLLIAISAVGVVALAFSHWAQYARARDPNVVDRIESARMSADYRFRIFRQGMDRLHDAPWLGIGLNRFREVYVPAAGDPAVDVVHAHNVFLQTALDVGLVGLGAYGGLLVILLVQADRSARGPSLVAAATAAGGGLSLVAAHVFGLGDAIALGAKAGLLQWSAAGIVLGAARVQARVTS